MERKKKGNARMMVWRTWKRKKQEMKLEMEDAQEEASDDAMIKLHCTGLHYITLYYDSSHYTTYMPLHYVSQMASHCIKLQYGTLNSIELPDVKLLQFITLKLITVFYVTQR